MASIKAAITGIQAFVPDYILTNKELETMVDTTDERISTRIVLKKGDNIILSAFGGDLTGGQLFEMGS